MCYSFVFSVHLTLRSTVSVLKPPLSQRVAQRTKCNHAESGENESSNRKSTFDTVVLKLMQNNSVKASVQEDSDTEGSTLLCLITAAQFHMC